MVNLGLLTAEIRWRVWGTPANFNGFRVLAALLHGTLVSSSFDSLRNTYYERRHFVCSVQAQPVRLATVSHYTLSLLMDFQTAFIM